MSAYIPRDDYAPTWPNLRPELETLLDSARKALAAWHSRHDHPYAEHVLEHAMDYLQTDLHCMFGDPIPAPKPKPAPVAPVVSPVPPPVHARREVGRLAIAS